MSQRELATELVRVGMKVDGPAVSRLEKGARALKLSEAYKVAEALDVEIDLLLSISATPAEIFRRSREGVETLFEQATSEARDFFEALFDFESFLAETPSVLKPAGRFPYRITDFENQVTDFPEWLVVKYAEEAKDLLSSTDDDSGEFCQLPSASTRDRYLELFLQALRSRILVPDEDANDSRLSTPSTQDPHSDGSPS